MTHAHPATRHFPFRMLVNAIPGASGVGILRVLRGLRLPCGCVAGVYERFDSSAVTIVDEAAPGCTARHVTGERVPDDRAAGRHVPQRGILTP